jgi:putative phosphoribosyl transferase
MPFADRADAGRRLAKRLRYLRDGDAVVVGLPRGGVPVALHVTLALDAPLDVIVVRKLGVPFHSELAMGAIGEGGVRILNGGVISAAGVSAGEIAEVERRERAELDRRARLFRRGRSPVALAGRTVVVVDDGIATGSTARAACQVARAHGAAKVVLAVPVAPPGWTRRLDGVADECVALETPPGFVAIGQFYADFSPTSDDEVVGCLEIAARPAVDAASAGARSPRDEEVEIHAGPVRLPDHLTVPDGAAGVVLFAHGSGSSRHSPRNRYVAGVLNRAGLGTLLFDLLTPDEERARANVFDVELLAQRLAQATRWLRSQAGLDDVAIGYFGAGTGAAAALWAAAGQPDIGAVVSRGGRPDLAAPRVGAVRAPTLLIVGGLDDTVLQLNRRAQAELRSQSRLAVVPGATHLFDEPGTLEAAAALARDWFRTYLASTARSVA